MERATIYFSLIPKFYYLAYLQNVTTKAFTNIIYSAFHIQDSSYTYHMSAFVVEDEYHSSQCTAIYWRSSCKEMKIYR